VWLCLERGANDLHIIELMPVPPYHLLHQKNLELFTLLVLAYQG